MPEKGKWTVSSRGNLFRLGKVPDIPLHIVHVDDHELYAKGVHTSCIQPFFPAAKITHFLNGTDAFNHIALNMRMHIVPDLVITDILHMGMNGVMLVTAIRDLERELQRTRPVPIIVLSFVALTHPSLGEDGMANAVFEKTADAATIVEAMERAMYDRN